MHNPRNPPRIAGADLSEERTHQLNGYGGNRVAMRITGITLKNFRCFPEKTIKITSDIVVIEGENGSGKSSLLEALHYACYLRSFRTHTTKELIHFDSDHFFVQAVFQETDTQAQSQVQVGFSGASKVVKFNQKNVSSYKDIVEHYRIVSATEDDIFLVKGSPDERRSFLNHALLLEDSNLVARMRSFRSVLSNRNILILRHGRVTPEFNDQLKIWTQQLWEQSIALGAERREYLVGLQDTVNKLLGAHFSKDDELQVVFCYQAKNVKAQESFEEFWARYKRDFFGDELRMRRSRFGAHLDDFTIEFRSRRAKHYASRGQQKLVVFLMKIAQLQLLADHGKPAIVLLDDFVTDFDANVIQRCLGVLRTLDTQIFLTCPLKSFIMPGKIGKFDAQVISL